MHGNSHDLRPFAHPPAALELSCLFPGRYPANGNILDVDISTLLQAGPGNVVKYRRRGWDFTMENVLRWFHEDAAFREVTDAAHPLDFKNADSVTGSVYLNELDRACRRRLSSRQASHEAGLYGLGVPRACCSSHVTCSYILRVHWHFAAPAPSADLRFTVF